MMAVAGGLVLIFEHGKSAPAVTPISAATDPYAAASRISQLAMSESSNLAGGKVTYLDGQITNQGQPDRRRELRSRCCSVTRLTRLRRTKPSR